MAPTLTRTRPIVTFDDLDIDDFGPLPVHRPASVEELCSLTRTAAGSGRALYPVGGRTMLDAGLPPTKPGFAIDTTALDRLIDYPARDMTITVGAGIAVSKLQGTLAAEGQWLPVDVPKPERATLGGAVALNVSGPRRFGYGTLRDYVIGISFVTDGGDEVKAGGRVVKNVAGYDLMKLQTGAVGTLGIITQITLKVRPKPEASALVTFGCDGSSLAAVLDLLHTSQSRPVAVEALNAAATRAIGIASSVAEWTVAVGFEEKSATVEWQMGTLLSELKSLPTRDVSEVRGPSAVELWRTLTDLQLRSESQAIWKLNLPASKVAEFLTGEMGSVPFLVHAHALNGIVWMHALAGAIAEPGDPAIARLERRVASLGGNWVVRSCPTAWKRVLRVWGSPAADREIMRHVKRTLDPKDVFNPGRLFGND